MPPAKSGYGYAEILSKASIGFKPIQLTNLEYGFLSRIDETSRYIFWDLSTRGVSGEVLARALTRLIDMKAWGLNTRTSRNKRRKLNRTLKRVLNAEEALKDTFRTPVHPHLNTIAELQMSSEWISDELHGWASARKRGKRGKRGFSPQTPFLIALMAYVREATGHSCYQELSELVSAAYRPAGSNENCSDESLKKLWQRHPNLRKDWKRRLGCIPVRRPKEGRKGHAPHLRRPLLGPPSKGFTPPKPNA